MKYEHQITTGQFEYIKEYFEGTPEEAVIAHQTLKKAWTGGEGLEERDFNLFIDNYLLGVKNHVETYLKMNRVQQDIIQVIKRSLARIKSRESKPVIE